MHASLITLGLIGILLFSTVVLSRWVPRHPRWRPFVIALNLAVTVRYLWWRATATLNWDGGWGTVVSLLVYAAELYGFLVVLHHYVIATRQIDRTTAPPDAAFSPTVDIFITTYNEAADILTRTIIGCQAIDYRNKRVYVIDDGRRPDIAVLARTLGVDYITRADNRGAKAGNLNNAMAQTTGDIVVTFDADHVPVSSFLTETLGHFRDASVAQVQTAHHFYNPDLFQSRLKSHEYIANEQDMFYHIVQPGRDVYNSSFYCGSGALFRRAAVAGIGGFPMTTVTEDLHTSVLLHSQGWRSVYVNKDLSAGLAPESFEGYLTQRRRWARGTLQVLLLQKGLFLKGLSAWQRVNYFATGWYWLYGFPRAIYLFAPLLFLLLGLRPLIVGDVADLLAYYIPHLVISITAFQLVNKGMRRIFWSDIYESCICLHLSATTLMFPFTGGKVRFAVTPKGKAAEQAASRGFWRLGWPNLALCGLMVGGILKGIVTILTSPAPDDATLINVIWAIYNLVVLGFGILLLRQPAQNRNAVRLPRHHACRLSWDGAQVEAVTTDLSETGVSLQLRTAHPLPGQLTVTITSREGRRVSLQARLVRCDVRDRALDVALEFVDRSPEQHRTLVELMYSAPDSWEGQHGLTLGAPDHVRRIVESLIAIFTAPQALRRLAPRFLCDLPAQITVPGGFVVSARAVDMSASGIGLRAPEALRVRPGSRVSLTVTWNAYERTTFEATVVNMRPAAMNQRLLGLDFVSLGPVQRHDLLKHLYGLGAQATTLGKAS